MLLSVLMLLVSAAPANQAHSQIVDIGDGVKVEVLDWAGLGRPVLLLPGSGNTAPVFEDFAPRPIACCRVHVYGITRRGYGLSSKPECGYSTPDLAEDDWRVRTKPLALTGRAPTCSGPNGRVVDHPLGMLRLQPRGRLRRDMSNWPTLGFAAPNGT